jgi:hypothetical protein
LSECGDVGGCGDVGERGDVGSCDDVGDCGDVGSCGDVGRREAKQTADGEVKPADGEVNPADGKVARQQISSSLSITEEEIRKLGLEIRQLKTKMKQEGFTGIKINQDTRMIGIVTRMTALKKRGSRRRKQDF